MDNFSRISRAMPDKKSPVLVPPPLSWVDNKWKTALLVGAASLAIWVLDALVDAVVFQRGPVLQLVFPRGPELWRSFVHLIFSVFLGGCLVMVYRKKQQMADDLEKALRRSELILNSAGEGIVVVDLEGCVNFVNSAAARMSGYEAQELTGRRLHEILHHCRIDGTPFPVEECPVQQTLKDGQLRRVKEDTFWTKEGRPFPVEYVATPLSTPSVTGAVVVFRGIMAQQAAAAELQKNRDFLENLLENSPDVIGLVDEHGRFTRWNRAAQEIFGYSAEEMLGKRAFDFYADPAELEAMLTQLRRDGFVRGYEINMRTKGGAIKPFTLSIRILQEQGRPAGSICVARDRAEIRRAMARLKEMNEQLHLEIQEREAFQEALEQANEKLRGLVQESEQRNRDISLLNELGDLLQACQSREEAYAALAQYASQLFPGDTGGLFVLNPSRNLLQEASRWGEAPLGEEIFAPDDCWAFRRGEAHRVQGSPTGLRCRHLASAPPLGDHLCIPMIAQGETLGLLYLQSHLCFLLPGSDLAGEHHAGAKERLALALAKQLSMALGSLDLRESLQHQAIRDPLTGLFNRRYMEESLEREISRVQRRGLPLGMVMIDLDHFKQFNDTHGHKAGDAMLAAVANLVKSQVRREDIVCRYGGEELLLILPEVAWEAAFQRAELLRKLVSQLRIDYLGMVLSPLTASFGVAAFPEHALDWEDLIRAADSAMYRAKMEGRNRVEGPPGPGRREPSHLFIQEQADVKS